ncbi:MAG TPA: Hpt domain-containing protein, partial [Candidatus Deferrimicrobium sp.]|nr:Hpt domain-containing protein [Candidatus Deferrimicrobium sp.]
MEQQTTFNKLLVIRDNLGNLPEEELIGGKVQGLLSELRDTLSTLESEAQVDQARLANLATFVNNRQSLDHMVRKVLLGLISKLVNNPSATTKPAPNISDLMGRIPGLEEALKISKNPEPAIQEDSSAEPLTPKIGEVPNINSLCITDASAEVAATCTTAENISFDTRELLGFFLQESAEQVEKFSEGLLNLERDGAGTELVNELFRSAHTLKGASGTMGFSTIVKLTHLAEDVLDDLRNGKNQVSPELIDTLLNVADRIKCMLADIQNSGDGQLDVEDLVIRLQSLLGKQKLA